MALYYQPKGCPVHGVSQLSDADVKVPKIGIKQTDFDKIAESITDQTVVNKELFDYTHSMLLKGIRQVWGDVKYSDKDFVFVERLKRNAAKFSGYKTATQTAHLAKSTKEAYGAINNAYNNSWLRTEYVHTVRSARAAKNWQKYEADKDLYPFLEYMPSSSAEPRSNHKLLYGVIKHLDDAFWNTWTPPSDWGCKCSVQQRRSDKGTLPLPENLQLPPKAMQNNTGKTGEIFSNQHPMIKAMGDKKAESVDKFVFEIVIQEYKNIRNVFMNAIKKQKIIGNELNFKGIDKNIKIVNNTFAKNLRSDYYFAERLTVLNNLSDFVEKAKIIEEKYIDLKDYTDEKTKKRKEKVIKYVFFEGEHLGIKVQFDVEERIDNQSKLYNIKILK